MKAHTLILGLIACVLLAGSGVVFSQGSENMSEERGSGKVKKMDTNSDGQISLDEFLTGAEKRFRKIDANEDGYVTAEEFREGRKVVRTKSREGREHGQEENDSE